MLPFHQSKRGLRLRLPRRPDPVLTEEELEVIETLLAQHIAWAKREMADRKVSEAIIRTRMDAASAITKIGKALGR